MELLRKLSLRLPKLRQYVRQWQVRAVVTDGSSSICRTKALSKAEAFAMVVFAMGIPTLADHVNESLLALKAEDLYNQKDYDRRELMLYLRHCATETPHDVNILWRLARANYEVANLKETSVAEKKELIYSAHSTICSALDENSDNFAVHKWAGIIISAVGDFEGTKASIANSYLIRNHWRRAVELNPNDATAHHLLGRWCFKIADISWIQRKAAQTLFASPPTATYEEALEHFQHAESISPGFWKKNLVQIAECHLKLDDPSTAREWLIRALQLPLRTEEDNECHKQAQALLSAL